MVKVMHSTTSWHGLRKAAEAGAEDLFEQGVVLLVDFMQLPGDGLGDAEGLRGIELKGFVEMSNGLSH